MSPRVMENMFNVDLFGLVWIAVAVVVLTLLSAQFYRGIEGRPLVSAARRRPSSQQLFLCGTLAVFWALDCLWHARAYVVTAPFWRPEISLTLRHGLPWLAPAVHLWEANPVLWDFVVLGGDAALACSFVMLFSRPSVWLLWSSAGWGIARWALAGATVSVGGFHPLGPGAYVVAAAAAYLLLRPQHYPVVLAGLCACLAVDAAATANQAQLAARLVAAMGFGVLAFAAFRRWSPFAVRLLAVSLATEMTVLGTGRQVWHAGLNALWVPLLVALVFGRDFVTPSMRTLTPKEE